MSHFVVTNRRLAQTGEREALIEIVDGGAMPFLRCGRIDLALDIPQSFSLFPDGDEEPTYETDAFTLAATSHTWGSFTLFDRICEVLRAAPDDRKNVLLFVHGYANTLKRTMRILKGLQQHYLDNPRSSIGCIVTFSWPSQDFPPLSYEEQVADALLSGKALARFIVKLKQYERITGNDLPVHVLVQSMGNQLLQETMRALEDLYPGKALPKAFLEVVLTGADVDNNALEPGEPLHRLPELGRRVHVYYGKDDRVLLMSKMLFHTRGHDRLGRTGPADASKVPEGVYLVDTTRVDGPDLDHMHFINSPPVIADLNRVFAGFRHAERSREIG